MRYDDYFCIFRRGRPPGVPFRAEIAEPRNPDEALKFPESNTEYRKS